MTTIFSKASFFSCCFVGLVTLISSCAPLDAKKVPGDAASFISYETITGPPQQFQWKELNAVNKSATRPIRATYHVSLTCGTQDFEETKTITLEPGAEQMISHWYAYQCFDAKADTRGAYFLNHRTKDQLKHKP